MDERPSIKDESQYDALRHKGLSKQAAARIANSDNNTNPTPYEDRTKDKLYDLAQQRNIEGRASMNKDQLITALRNQRNEDNP